MGIGSDIEQIIRDASDQVGGFMTAAEREEYATSRFVQAAFSDFAGGESGAKLLETLNAGRALSGFLTGARLLNWVGWYITFQQVNTWLISQLDRVPMAGHAIARTWRILTQGPAYWLLTWITNRIEQQAGTWTHQFVQSVGWAGAQSGLATKQDITNITLAPPGPVGVPSIALSQQVAALTTGEHHLQQEIDSIEYRLDHPANGTGTAPQVWAEIGALQRAVSALNNAAVDTRTELNSISDRQQALEHRMTTLASQIHGVSAVAVTWQDIANEVDVIGSQVDYLSNTTAQNLAHQERQLTQLAPLGILLQPGVAGLRVLRSLEDKPCQCPEFGNVPNWIGTALAVMEYVENG